MRIFLPLVLAGCSAALAAAPPTPSDSQDDLPDARDLAALRALGPAGLDALLARYDRAPSPALAAEIDTVAGQRYATASRLYWYTDLAEAEAAAHARHVPILSLRMLGDLREDLSCANSRLFRATLYADAGVSAFLRDHFVLHWSSARPVPVVTIDFGDGEHRLVRTTTGNSAHYVLDDDGHVLDVLPGLYAPSVFRARLNDSVALADDVRGATDARRAARVVAYHRDRIAAAQAAWQQVVGAVAPPDPRELARAGEVGSRLARGQRTAMTKAMVEAPDLRRLGADPGTIDRDDVAAWAIAGGILYGIPGMRALANTSYGVRRRTAGEPLFDARSRALIEQIASVPARPLSRLELNAMIARLEQSVVADTAQNELVLRRQISERIADTGGTGTFASLDDYVYATVFHMPPDDPWNGLVTDTDFSGLPGDGVQTRAPASP